MDVTWYGHGCFRLRGKGAAVVTDPYPPSLGPKLPRLEADLVTVSHDHDNHSYVRVVGKDPYLIDGPGEYEVGGVTVLGVATFHDAQSGAALGRNTVYLIEVDDVRICHLGDLGHTLDDEALERLGDVDVLLVPVGGGNALDASHGAEVVRQVEPRFVVPMHYALPVIKRELQPVERFLKEMGIERS
ncbi:MAG: MBL fold metallo-hydrolase, partial [Candidatus Dormibacteraeota bacterium]|nr:MBL fold metallo-hydrolase [Candidatus Dormibacteraeota bacterium]MBO0760785.1 MBL fold metallo-hydrolase [Candidatus Dormibacteraeota bacterium]